MIGKVETYINSIIDSGKGVFMALIDPDEQDPQKAVETAKLMVEGGADIIMLGGSTGLKTDVVDETARQIKECINIPLHLFPGSLNNVTSYADSLYFMSLLNSNNPYWISNVQSQASNMIKKMGLEPIPTAYLVFEPGQTVGRVGEADLLPRNNAKIAVGYSLAAQYFGMRFVILESGSGAPSPVPIDLIAKIRANCSLRIVVAGGVKTPSQARELIKAGAHCIHVGTVLEGDNNRSLDKVKAFAKAIHME